MKSKAKLTTEKFEIGEPVKGKFHLRKGAKFSWHFVDVAARMVAAGCSQENLAFFFAVKPETIAKWAVRYPQFRQALDCGYDESINHVIARGLRAAAGYDSEEVQEEYAIETDPETGEQEERLVSKKIKKKHHPPNPTLHTFYVTNMAKQRFKDTKEVEINNNKTLTVEIGANAASQIEKLAGALSSLPIGTKYVESKIIENQHA